MSENDDKIQSALRRDAAGPAGEPGIVEEFLTTLRGRHGPLMIFTLLYSIALFIGAIWAGVKFYHAVTVGAQLQWGGLALLLILFVMFIKVWFWLEMQTNRVLREVKRLELLLAARRGGE